MHSVPRLMNGQGASSASARSSTRPSSRAPPRRRWPGSAIGKTITLTRTYDHRVIQGAQSGEFLQKVHELLIGANGFYEEIFRALRIPYEPIHWVSDIPTGHEDDVNKTARVQELINAFRVRGHLMADIDPLEYPSARTPTSTSQATA